MGERSPDAAAGKGGVSRLALLALLPLALFILALQAFVTDALPLAWRWPWIPSLGIDLAFRLDGLALVFVLLISGIGSFVLLYAGGYMARAPGRRRLFALLLGFMVAMVGCVTADDLFVLFIFWELTSFSSFLLVGFKHEVAANRKAAQQALMVTGGGGLALLAGVVLLSQAAGTSSIPALLDSAPRWTSAPLVPLAVGCVLVGAFTKSAQFPFHFWLPGAMGAPTPVSAYLHSATMVKLGVYLLARLHPALGENPLWQVILVSVGALTSVLAMVLTISERDLKRILAWSTVAALGTLVMLIGLPGEGAATAAVAFLLAHALYKAPLFFVAGNVDLAAGTRIIDELGALGRRLPYTATAACLAGLSMAGIPLSFGYVAKDVIKTAKSDAGSFEWVVYAGVAVSAASVAAAAIATVRIFRLGGEARPVGVREGSIATWLPPLAIAALGIVFGFFPSLLHQLICVSASAMGPASLLEPPSWSLDEMAQLTALGITLALGAALFFAWDWIHSVQRQLALPALIRPTAWYQGLLAAIPWLAARVHRWLQSGRLTAYTTLVVTFAVTALGLALVRLPERAWPAFVAPAGAPTLAVTGAVGLLVGASIAVCIVRGSFVLLLVSGAVGLCSAILFLFLGAPDVAFTQLTVEVAFVVVLAAILLRVRRLDLVPPPRPSRAQATLRLLLALASGAVVALLLLLASGATPDPSLPHFFAERSVPAAHGRNVVNVILVDFRAVDTLGEILVVLVTFLGAIPLLRSLRRRPLITVAAPAVVVAGKEAVRDMSRRAHLFDVAARGLYPVMLAGALAILLRGHNEPGGGFIAGMVAVAATSMLAVARGSGVALGRLPLGPSRLAAASVLLSLTSGLPALLAGQPYMTHYWASIPLGWTVLEVSTVQLFDLGVCGAVWGALGGLCAQAIAIDEQPQAARGEVRS